MHIRPFIDDDYPAITRLHNQVYGDFAKFEHELRYQDQHMPSHCRWARFSAIRDDGCVVGFAQYHHFPYMFHPHKFALDLVIDPLHQGQGVEERLYATVVEAPEPLQPWSLVCWARADMPCTLGFLQRSGFEPHSEMFTSALDLTRFDPAPWQESIAEVAGKGIALRSLEALGATDPDVRRKVYDMWCEVRGDVPIPDGETRSEPMSFDEYWQETENHSLLPAGYFLAIDGARYVGTSQLFTSPLTDRLRTGLTAVRRSHRRRGIALALKVRALGFARERGYRRIVTDNAAVNTGMLAINGQLGFERNPVWTRYLKTFRQVRSEDVNG